MDGVTDILVVSIPVALLWKVRINVRQKIGLGVFLCLSLVMAVVSIIRIAGIKLAGGTVDIVWLVFWQQQECSIAVAMVSVSAFRSLFVANASNNVSPKHPKLSSYWRRRLLQKRSNFDRDNGSSGKELPQIPSATLTGMRTMIRGAGMSTMWPNESEPEDLLLPPRNHRAQGKQHRLKKKTAEVERCSREMTSSSNIRLMEDSNVV